MSDFHYNTEVGLDGGGDRWESFYWTTEPPTEPGWYWVTYAGGVSVIKVRQDEKGLWIEDGYYSDQRLAIDSAWKYHSHWLGPLPEPELPK